jgi:hypothetical protein
MGDAKILTDLAIGGIIDQWQPEAAAQPATASAQAQNGSTAKAA